MGNLLEADEVEFGVTVNLRSGARKARSISLLARSTDRRELGKVRFKPLAQTYTLASHGVHPSGAGILCDFKERFQCYKHAFESNRARQLRMGQG